MVKNDRKFASLATGNHGRICFYISNESLFHGRKHGAIHINIQFKLLKIVREVCFLTIMYCVIIGQKKVHRTGAADRNRQCSKLRFYFVHTPGA